MLGAHFDAFALVVAQHFHEPVIHVHDHAHHTAVVAFQNHHVVTHEELLGHAVRLHLDFLIELFDVCGLQRNTAAVLLAALYDANEPLQLPCDNFHTFVLVINVLM